MSTSSSAQSLPPETADFYRDALQILKDADAPFLVGGAYAFTCYTDITRHTKDLDVFVRASDLEQVLSAFAEADYRTEMTYPHWLAKAHCGEDSVDLIFRSGNGVSEVDDSWFERVIEDEVLGIPVKLCPPEEIIWSKAYVMERERYDGADIAHLLLGSAEELDWEHLLERFGTHWRVLLAHLLLFGFIYPSERGRIPQEVMQQLLDRLQEDVEHGTPQAERLCRGTLLSRAQYLVDVEEWGYQDARQRPYGQMTAEEIEQWTEAISEENRPSS